MKDKKLDELKKTAADAQKETNQKATELSDDALDGVAGGLSHVSAGSEGVKL